MAEWIHDWFLWCWDCEPNLSQSFTHRHDRDRARFSHQKAFPSHSMAVGRVIEGVSKRDRS